MSNYDGSSVSDIISRSLAGTRNPSSSSHLRHSVKISLLEFIENSTSAEIAKLYASPSSCLSIFRSLPDLCKQYILRVLYLNEPLPLKTVYDWALPEKKMEYEYVMTTLKKAQILDFSDQTLFKLNDNFRVQLKNALTGASHPNSFGAVVQTIEKNAPTIQNLDEIAVNQWESVLQFMVVATQQNNSVALPTKGIFILLQNAGLMTPRSEERIRVLQHPAINALSITQKGFQFLLQDINTQTWIILLHYVEQAEQLKLNKMEVVSFILQLATLQLGMDYAIDQLTPSQLAVLGDFRDLGMIYRTSSQSKRFYPTRLVTTLTVADVAQVTNDLSTQKSKSQAWTVVETNFRVYVYSGSDLQIAILRLFVKLECRFPNLVVGKLTRESVRNALRLGIVADQIIQYLETHAHPVMLKVDTPIVPENVCDQLKIWEKERNRLKITKGFMYSNFDSLDIFDTVSHHATEMSCLLHRGDQKKMLIVTEPGHSTLKAKLSGEKTIFSR